MCSFLKSRRDYRFMISTRKGVCLICQLFADSIIFKQHIFCSFLRWTYGNKIGAICKPRHWNLGIGTGIGIGIDITNDIVSSSIRLRIPNLAGWQLRMRGPHPKSHVTLWYRGHVTNKKRYNSFFTVWGLRMREPHPQSHVTHRPSGHVTIEDVISPLTQGLCIPNLAGWWLRMREPAPQSHLIH